MICLRNNRFQIEMTVRYDTYKGRVGDIHGEKNNSAMVVVVGEWVDGELIEIERVDEMILNVGGGTWSMWELQIIDVTGRKKKDKTAASVPPL